MSKNTQSLQKMSTMSGYLSEVFSEELCLPRAKLELKKNFTLKETVLSCFKVFQFKKIHLTCLVASKMNFTSVKNPSCTHHFVLGVIFLFCHKLNSFVNSSIFLYNLKKNVQESHQTVWNWRRFSQRRPNFAF